MKKKINKRMVWIITLLVICYFLAGVTVPFIRYKEITPQTQAAVAGQKLYQDTAGADRAKLIKTNMEAWEERIHLINSAKERIILSTFDMRAEESTKDMAAVLLNKADEGVKIQILVDGVSGMLRMEGRAFFYALSSHPNVEIKLYNKPNILLPWKTQGRLHDKYMIVDTKTYILGGRNTFNYFLGEYDTNNPNMDLEVLILNTNWQDKANQESSLFSLEDYFERVWNQTDCTYFHENERLQQKKSVLKERKLLQELYLTLKEQNPKLFSTKDYEADTYETGKITLFSQSTDVYAKEPVVFYQLAQLMKQAKNSVVIHTPYAVCNTMMYETLEDIAQKVPSAKLVVNSVENGDNFVATSDYLRHKKDFLKTGISLYEYDGGISNHSKAVIVDDEMAVIGSYNMDLRSTYVNTELMLAVQSKGLAKELRKHMDLIEKDCRRVLDEKRYETPEHIVVEQVPGWKKIAWYITGLFMQPFRCLI